MCRISARELGSRTIASCATIARFSLADRLNGALHFAFLAESGGGHRHAPACQGRGMYHPERFGSSVPTGDRRPLEYEQVWLTGCL